MCVEGGVGHVGGGGFGGAEARSRGPHRAAGGMSEGEVPAVRSAGAPGRGRGRRRGSAA